ncbi:hypothetical protein Tco_1289219, partial [Tanacetum coccineum]
VLAVDVEVADESRWVQLSPRGGRRWVSAGGFWGYAI